MAQLAFGAAGAAVGSYFGQPGLGFTAGTLIYSFLNPPDDIIQEGQRLNNQLTTTSSYGVMRPIIYGTMPVSGNIIDGSNLYETKHESSQDSSGKGGSFGGGAQDVVTITYTYSIDLAVGLGEGPIEDIIKIYANEKLIYDISPGSRINSPDWLNITIYKGTEDQLPDPTFQVLHGDDTPAYRGEAYVVFTRFQLQDFGNQIPSFRFLVVKNAAPVQSEETKTFTGGGNVGALLYDRKSSLLYYACTGQEGSRMGFVYDPRIENTVISLRWSDDFTGMDEGGGGGLFSVPTVTLDGLTIYQGPNSHFFANVEFGSTPGIAIYESKSGAYVGFAALGIDADSNTKTLVPDEKLGAIYREHSDVSNFYSWLQLYNLSIGQAGLGILNVGRVNIPVPDRDDVFQWRWDTESSYSEGTTREGRIAVHAVDSVDTIDYLCYINTDEPLLVEQLITLTEYTYQDITAIAWDSIQQYFWVMGQSNNTGQTRIKAYDVSGNEVPNHSFEWANTLYTLSSQYFTYDPTTFSIWLYSAGSIYQWHTINHTLDQISGFSSTAPGTGDSIYYINSTRSVWRKKDQGQLDIYRLGRITETGVGLDAIVDDLCKRADLQSGQYDVTDLSSVTVDGYKIEKQGDIRSNIVPLQQTYIFDGIDKADLIDFKFRGQASVATIQEKDLGASDGANIGGEYIKIDRVMDLDLPKKTEITYYNKGQEYESNTQMARRTASYLKENSSRITLPVVLSDDEGAQLADITQHLPYIEREIYDIKVLPKWQYLVSGDVINIEYNNRTFVARIINKDFEDGIVSFRCTREESSIIQSFLSGGSAPGRVVEIQYNPLTNSVHLDIPLLQERNDNAGYYLSACGMSDNWTGGNIYKSADGNSFNITATVLTPSVIGTTDQALPGVDPSSYWDRTSQARVYMRCGELESVTEEQALQGENTFALGAHGRWELINIVNVTLVEEGVYDCDTFLRGRLGTEWAIGTHQLGDALCKLTTDDLTYINDALSNLNTQFLYRAVSLGGSIYSDRVIDQFHTNTGVCLRPYAPANLTATKNPTTLDILFTWEPRTRYPWANFWSGIPSDPNNFELDIPLFGTSNVRTVTITNDTQYNYPRADQLTDGYPASDITVADFNNYQISDSVGRGYAATISTGVGPDPHPMPTYAQTIGATSIWECGDAAEPITDIFNNYPLDCEAAFVLGQPAILPGSLKTCVEFSLAGRAFSTTAPAGGLIDVFNFSLLLIYRPDATITTDDQRLSYIILDPGGSNITTALIKMNSDGTPEAVHNNGSGEAVAIKDTNAIPVGTTKQLIITFSSGGIDVLGDFNFYVDGQLIGSQQARVRTGENTSTQIYRSAWASGFPLNEQHRQSHIILFDHALTTQEINNLFLTSGL